MDDKLNILQETSEISQTIAGIGNRNVYNAPPGYFNNLPALVMAKLTEQQVPAAPAPFSVPEGYFDGLAGNILAKIKGQHAASGEAFFTPPVEMGLPLYLPTPYSVPDGYFSDLSENILANIKLEESVLEIEEQLIPRGLATPYTIPVGYFASLSDSVMAAIKQEEAVSEINRQLPAALPTPYSVPGDYFNSLAGNVMAAIKQEGAVAGIDEQFIPAGLPTPYKVPAGYLDGFAGNVMAAIHIHQKTRSDVYEELQEIAPILNTISTQTPYSVPVGYFEQLEVSVPVKQEKQAAKVVSMRNSRISFMRYAVAACAAVLLGIGGYWFVKPGNEKGEDTNIDKLVASLSTADINAYLASQAQAPVDVVPTEIVPAAADDQAPDIQEDIDETSTQEIQQYLKDNSEPDEKGGKDI